VKLRNPLTISLACNLALVIALVVMRRGSAAKTNASPSDTSLPATVTAAKLSPTATETPVPVVPWRLIASADYRQYVANLRAVGCPEWLLRDIIVADIDDLYQQKSRTDPVSFAPWQGTDQRRKASRGRSAKLNALRQEKWALVKSLLGYEWDNHGDEVWNQGFLTALTFGFLPDDKVSQVLLLKDQYAESAQNIREDANFILIGEDRARLQTLYDEFGAEMSRLLNPSELDELQLRAQQSFLIAHDMHFDGVAISREELRGIVRLSKSFKDMARDEFVSAPPLSEAEQARRKEAFDAQVKTLLGPGRYADYQRAQDFNFRETFEFTQRNALPQTAAIRIYDARRSAEAQSNEIQKDGNLSPEERAAALAVLKAATMNTVSSVLGGSYHNYLAGPGHWFNALVQPPEPQTGSQTQ